MKRLIIISVLHLWALSVFGTKQDQRDYIKKYSAIAVSEMYRTGIPASIKLAQAILESNAGKSALSLKSNNHFGIKCGRNWDGRSTKFKDDDYKNGKLINSCFRVYNNPDESFKDHSDFIAHKNRRYQFLFKLDKSDYVGWAKGLKKAGYATDPRYSRLLISLIESLELYKYDGEGTKRQRLAIAAKNKRSSSSKRKREAFLDTKIDIKYTDDIFQINEVNAVKAEKDQTPEIIALNYGVLIRQLMQFNEDLFDPNQILKEGETIYLSKKQKKTKGRKDIHIVKFEESIQSIADQYGIMTESLMKLNRMKPGFEPAQGQRIYLKRKRSKKDNLVGSMDSPNVHPPLEILKEENENKEVNSDVPIVSDILEQENKETHVAIRPSSAKIHIVKEGDTLYNLSKKYGLTISYLKKINNLTNDIIKVDQELTIN